VRRVTVALIMLALTLVVTAAPAWAATADVSPSLADNNGPSPPRPPPPPVGGVGTATGVLPGTPVFVRLSPDNNVVAAVTTAAARVGLGQVTVDRFRADCSPIPGEVVVCRDINLIAAGQRTVTYQGPGWCVVSLDPRVGGATVGVNQVTRAMKKCLVRRTRGANGAPAFGPEV
jgi:hypothetical protein